ncbi:MAG: type III pantothenate kinase [Lachnospiraceae bacterium]|uniref:Type III pantothenate kinase n=1 Tax=Candidatus Weimeria bifida TaxID=2599074 RepID=A0A6N7J2S1_9FIRM|nr:type III pantothenate kinase [Candidatus Weimeria bifida]RRF96820.1 MAG: type III pantothenate kinase [Lachnospiraceae bacterium]
MLLAVDVGNTNITLGVFRDSVLIGNFRLNTGISRTSDEYGITIRNILYNNGLDHKEIKDCIIASVVPALMHSLTSGIIKYFNTKPIIVAAGIKTGINIQTETPGQIGADRIVDAAGAYELYGGPLIVIDFGTATTYDFVDKNGSFKYGVTAPGIRISAKALWEDAAKLPEVEIRKPKSILARETISSMQAGLVYGQIGATEYIVRNMIKETGCKDVKVIATGGLGKMISRETSVIDKYNPDLTLQGMRFIFEKQDHRRS